MEKLQDIIDKVRQIYRFDTKLRKIIQLPVSVRITEETSGLNINAIIFEDLSTKQTVLVARKNIMYLEDNVWSTILEYRDFEELLSL